MIDLLIDKFTNIERYKNGNKGGLTSKHRRLRAICRYAEKMGIYDVDMKAFECLGDNIKWITTTSKATSYKDLARLEYIDSNTTSLFFFLFLCLSHTFTPCVLLFLFLSLSFYLSV